MVREGYAFGFPPLVAGLAALLFQTPLMVAAGVLLLALGLFVFYFSAIQTAPSPPTPKL